jgi:hypothetical protein
MVPKKEIWEKTSHNVQDFIWIQNFVGDKIAGFGS